MSEQVTEAGARVLRRLAAGGVLFHDRGELFWRGDDGDEPDYETALQLDRAGLIDLFWTLPEVTDAGRAWVAAHPQDATTAPPGPGNE